MLALSPPPRPRRPPTTSSQLATTVHGILVAVGRLWRARQSCMLIVLWARLQAVLGRLALTWARGPGLCGSACAVLWGPH
jgi:hypothetical protein